MQTFVKLPRALLHHLGKEDTSKPWERLRGGLGLKNTLDLTELDCLQSAFSLKIRLVLISSSATANHEVIITIRD